MVTFMLWLAHENRKLNQEAYKSFIICITSFSLELCLLYIIMLHSDADMDRWHLTLSYQSVR